MSNDPLTGACAGVWEPWFQQRSVRNRNPECGLVLRPKNPGAISDGFSIPPVAPVTPKNNNARATFCNAFVKKSKMHSGVTFFGSDVSFIFESDVSFMDFGVTRF